MLLQLSNVREAIEIYQEQGPDIGCVFIDLTMPQMDGVELFHELRRIKKDIPIIISSGYTEEQTMSRFGDIQPEGFIQKPYRMKQLAAKIQMILSSPGVLKQPACDRPV